jgi:hypothetical protein
MYQIRLEGINSNYETQLSSEFVVVTNKTEDGANKCQLTVYLPRQGSVRIRGSHMLVLLIIEK